MEGWGKGKGWAMKLGMMLEVEETFTTIWLSRSSEVRVKVRRWPQSPFGTIFQFSFKLFSFPILSLSNIHDAPYGHYVKTWRHPQNQARVTCNMHKNLVRFGRVVFEICKQTDRQTSSHSHHNSKFHQNHTIFEISPFSRLSKRLLSAILHF